MAPPPWANGVNHDYATTQLDYRPTKRLPGSAHHRPFTHNQLTAGIDALSLGPRPRSPFSELLSSPTDHHHHNHHSPNPTHHERHHSDAPPVPSGVFGEAGAQVVRSLSAASSCSRSGLFGGLRPRPSSAGGTALRFRGGSDQALGDEGGSESGGECEGEGCEGGCAGVGGAGADAVDDYSARAFDPQKYDASRLGNNKKRKVPASQMPTAHNQLDDDDDDDEHEEVPAAVSIDRNGAATTRRTIRAPVDPPRTAAAALAKLREAPPHISLDAHSLSHIKHLKRQRRSQAHVNDPLQLPPVAVYYSPARYSTGPPPLPPGSGLKGSKALKAAKKYEQERKKEQDRVNKALGGPGLRLIDLWNPTDDPAIEAPTRKPVPKPVPPRPQPFAQPKSGFEAYPTPSEAYPTPPPSSDEADVQPSSPALGVDGPLALERFSFQGPSLPVIAERWQALQAQIEYLRTAKERAAEAEQLEKERRHEHAKQVQADLDRKAAQADAAAAAAEPPSPPPPPAPPSTNQLPPPTMGTVSPVVHTQEPPCPPSAGPKPKSKKGKKRSAHANANNPHFKSNYIPSRMPAAAAQSHHDSAQALTSWPASEEAIASGRAAGTGARRAAGYFAGSEEWLCAFCDYEIFWGEESHLVKATKRRQKVLEVRRKSKKKAAKLTAAKEAAQDGAHPPQPPPLPAPVHVPAHH